MIDTAHRTQTHGVPHRSDHPGQDGHLVPEFRSSLAAIWNAVHMLSYARDEITVERVRQMVTRQVEFLSQVMDDIEARRATGDGRPRADTLDG